MNTRTWLTLVICSLPISEAWAVRQTEVDVVADLTQEGRKLVHPDSAHPVYYLPLMSGFLEPARPVAHGENPPPAGGVAHQVAVALSRQGYLLAHPGLRVTARLEVAYADGVVVTVPPDPRLDRPFVLNQPGDVPLSVSMIESANGPYSFLHSHRNGRDHLLPPLARVFRTIDPIHGPVLQAMPAIVVLIQWGDLHSAENNPHLIGLDLPNWVAMLAGDSFDKLNEWDQDEIIQRTSADRFFVMVTAFDFKSCISGRKKTLLWRTRMSVPSNQDQRFDDMLPVMIKAGESRLGRESSHPEFSIVPLTEEGSVIIGTPEVKDYQEAPLTPPNTGSDRFFPLKFVPNK